MYAGCNRADQPRQPSFLAKHPGAHCVSVYVKPNLARLYTGEHSSIRKILNIERWPRL